MTVSRLEGKYKLSQNKSQTDRENIAESLLNSPDPIERNIGVEMKQNLVSKTARLDFDQE